MFISTIFPILLILSAGYCFGKYTNAQTEPISKLSIIILSPALIFSFLIDNELTSREVNQIILSVSIFTILMIIITIIVFKVTRFNKWISPALLSVVFPNSGNFGLPIILVAYGEQALTYAIVILVIDFVLMYTIGIYFANMEKSNWRASVLQIIKLPTTYATLLAIFVNVLHISIPQYIFDPIKMLGEAMIPIAIVLLGMQMARTKIKGYVFLTSMSTILKIIIAPLVIILIMIILGIDGTLAKVIVLQHAMPTAVVMTLIAIEYDSNPNLVANNTVVTTLFSFLSISILLSLLEVLF